jgi:hypothetical protein
MIEFTHITHIGQIASFQTAIGSQKTYVVKGWYLDANGCLKTYGNGYEESFVSDTNYEQPK